MVINEGIKFQLAPPGQHMQNTAERVICTFKNNLLEGLVMCCPDFTIREWDRLLPQTELK